MSPAAIAPPRNTDFPVAKGKVRNARGHLGGVALDLHAAAAPVSELAAGHVPGDVLRGQLETSRQALDDACQAGTVRLAGGYETERHGPKLICWGLSSRADASVGVGASR